MQAIDLGNGAGAIIAGNDKGQLLKIQYKLPHSSQPDIDEIQAGTSSLMMAF